MPNLHFYYIDRLPYQNNCPLPPAPPSETLAKEPAEDDSLPDESPIEFVNGSDLEFLNKHIYKDLKCTDCKQHTKVKLGRKLDGHFFLKIIHLWILQK